MKKRGKRILSLMAALVLLAGLLPVNARAAAVSTADLGALPDSFAPLSETFTLNGDSRLFVAAASQPEGDLLSTVQLIRQELAVLGSPVSQQLKIVWGDENWAQPGDIVLKLDNASGLAADGYKLQVGSKTVITAPNCRGLIYGSNTLMKHLRKAGSATIQGFTAKDVPDTKQRAVSLDCGRKYFTKDWICNFIRQISWMGYNTLELHFSDDSGFRIDIWDEAVYTDSYRPQNDFTWLCGSNHTSWTLESYQNDPDEGRYLTATELVEILQTAKQYQIDVIPAFDSPSHLDYTTWKFEQNYDSNNSYSFYSTYDQKTYYARDINGIINYTDSKDWSTDLMWPYYSAINFTSPQAKAFLFELYIDIANFFKEYSGSTDFSIGADEVQLNTRNLAYGYSYKWGFPDFVSYINELNRLLNDHGYTVRMYNDFMGSINYNASNYDFDSNIQILYWDSPFNPNTGGNDNHTQPVSYFVNQGRILYNCIQTNTYYALRITTENDSTAEDARSKNNDWWTFYHSTEDLIYDEWYPADISEHGHKSEDAPDVPDINLGGAYFLIWCDYACVSTEQDIWNGVEDKTERNKGEWYSLLDRMASNIIKMWNSDINQTLSFEDFAALRDAVGKFPGLGTETDACSAKVTLPAATEPIRDCRTALAEVMARQPALEPGYYTEASYAAYLQAYTAAQTLIHDANATDDQLRDQAQTLENARKALTPRAYEITVESKATVNGETRLISAKTYCINPDSSLFQIYLPLQTGYTFIRSEGATFYPLASGDGSGYLRGSAPSDATVTVWYESDPDRSYLDSLLRNAEENASFYNAASWAAYLAALNAAKSFSVSASVTQDQVDQLSRGLSEAETALVVPDCAPEILKIELLNPTVRKGKLIGLRVTTSGGVSGLDVDSQTLETCTAKMHTDNDGNAVKVWFITFPAERAGSIIYTLRATGGTAAVTAQFNIQIN